MNLASGAAFALTVFGLLGLLAAAAVVVRSGILKETNAVLEKALHVEREERREDNRRCQREIDALRGQVSTLSEKFAGVIAEKVVATVKHDLYDL